MANVLIEENTMVAIGDAIRAKTGKTDKILPADMPGEIEGITGGGSGGGNNLMFHTKLCGDPTALSYEDSFTVTMSSYLPTNAVNIVGRYRVRYEAKKSDGTTLGYTDYVEKIITSEDDYTKTPRPGNSEYSLYNFGSFDVSYPGAYVLFLNSSSEQLSYELPGVYMEDNILHLGEDVRAIYSTNSYDRNMVSPWYIRGIDMRKSSMTVLEDFYGSENVYLEVVYLPPGLTNINQSSCIDNANLKELHFTSLTPPKISSAYYVDRLPTTCTIYVPAGTIDAYKAAANYPSPSTYTYVEE